MKLFKRQNAEKNDIEILIEYPRPEKIIDKLEAAIKAVDSKLKCFNDKAELYVHLSDIFYFECVDKKIFVYLEKAVYRCEQRLFQIENLMAGFNFVKISKSVILNLGVLMSIKPLLNSRMEAVLCNGEKLNISRKYLNCIKEKLEAVR